VSKRQMTEDLLESCLVSDIVVQGVLRDLVQ
jgi:hypothetical protein